MPDKEILALIIAVLGIILGSYSVALGNIWMSLETQTGFVAVAFDTIAIVLSLSSRKKDDSEG